MKIKLNYTDRKRIPKKNVVIELIRQNHSVSFKLTKLEINDLKLPSDAKIYVEAYYRTELKRFDFGTVASSICPASFNLDDIAYSENLKFRVLVIDPKDYKILAHAKNITFKFQAEKKPILPVEFSDLGSELWRIEFENQGGPPILCINKKIPNIEYLAKQDTQFFVYVYPAAFREILLHMIFIDGVDSTDEPTADWHKDWLDFSKGIAPASFSSPPIIDCKDPKFDKYKAKEWIEGIVTEFSNKHKNKFDEYLKNRGNL